ncbi:uncharacterized protein K02A2.6-like [Leptopilina heterotoma]|uniref:uncharacterized protein K02A2.6-like n=1 Tax=Leptopilina heterotoma TaxID=63436 RepID=UPI001CA9BE7B|nr:uncharacterized protein K02A2.6-like [Leptopilina heterotoma]
MADAEEGNIQGGNMTQIAMHAQIGTLAEYKLGEDWQIYEERLDQYLTANYIKDDRKVSVLLTVIGPDAYKVIRDLANPDLPKDKTYLQLCEILRSQFSPRVSTFRKRIEFYETRQEQNEKVSEWYARIKKVAADCKFGNQLEAILKDKFISGLCEGRIRERLCEEEVTKSLNDLKEIALNKELSLQEVEVNKMKFIPGKRGGSAGSKAQEHSKWQQTQDNTNKGPKGNNVSKKGSACFACGKGGHVFATCKYKKYKCKICNEVGHLAVICKSKTNRVHFSEEAEELEMFYVKSENGVTQFMLTVLIQGVPVKCELDSGAGRSCIPIDFFERNLSKCTKKLNTSVQLAFYDGSIVQPAEEFEAKVVYKGKNVVKKILLVDKGSRPLLGRDLMQCFGIKFNIPVETYKIDEKPNGDDLIQLLEKYDEIFKQELGKYAYEKIKLEVTPDIKPIFIKPKPVAYAFRDNVDKIIDKLESDGMLTKVNNGKFGTPLVLIIKSDGSIRLCANYKITINKYLVDVNYPLPRIEDLFTALQGGEEFTKLDFLNAFNQLELDEETSDLLTWSTCKGIYRVNRLPFGTKPASAIFQRIIEKVLQGLPGVVCFIDDVVVTGKTRQEHLANLNGVLGRLQNAGFKLNIKKCKFFQKEIRFLGHVINKEGLKTDNSKVEAILKIPRPTNKSEVKTWVGTVNYYSKFIPNVAEILLPMYELLRDNTEFKWTEKCENAFIKTRKEITSKKVLVHFDRTKPINMYCDASQFGIAAVLTHVFFGGTERPIAFASRVLQPAEKNYAVIQKEALAIYFGAKKFYQYLIGNKFNLFSDHKPLEALFGKNKSLPEMAAGRLQRWAVFLSGFEYNFKHIKGKSNCIADGLSRLPIETQVIHGFDDGCEYFNFIESSVPLTAIQLKVETRKDPELSTIYSYVEKGWPIKIESHLKPYEIRKTEIYIDQGVLMWGYRILVPAKFRNKLLEELHLTHAGMGKLKSMARAYFWWPLLDKEIKKIALQCHACQLERPDPQKAKLKLFEEATFPFERIHIDFLGPIAKKMFLIVTDAFTKWPEVFSMNNTTKALNDQKNKNVQIDTIVNRYLLNYRTSTHCTTGETPAKLMFGRAIRTRFDFLKPDGKNKAIERIKRNHKGCENMWKRHMDQMLKVYEIVKNDDNTKEKSENVEIILDPVCVKNRIDQNENSQEKANVDSEITDVENELQKNNVDEQEKDVCALQMDSNVIRLIAESSSGNKLTAGH